MLINDYLGNVLRFWFFFTPLFDWHNTLSILCEKRFLEHISSSTLSMSKLYIYCYKHICSYSTYCIPFSEITSVFWYSKKIQWLYFSSVKYIVWHIISQRCKNQRMLVKSRSFMFIVEFSFLSVRLFSLQQVFCWGPTAVWDSAYSPPCS